MRNSRKKAIAILTLVSVAFASFAGCSDKDESSAALREDQIKTPFYYVDKAGESSDDDYFLGNEADPTEGSSDSEGATEYQPVTDDAGEPVTTYVTVTDDSGAQVTDTDGSVVIIAETVTTVVVKDPEVTTGGNSDYIPHTDRAYAMWLDISKGDEGFYFEDSFIEVTFRIKEDIPDGAYDIVISDPDFSSIMGQTVKPDKVSNGKIFVNTDAEKQEDFSSAKNLVVSGDYVSGKQGDEVTLSFNIKNNPGLAAMMFWFDYDGNAFELVDCVASGEFAEIANGTQTGTAKSNKN